MFYTQISSGWGRRLAGISLLSITASTLSLSAFAGSISTTTNTGNGITGETKDTVGTPVGVKGIANGFLIGGGSIDSIGVEGMSDSNTGTGVKGRGGLYGVYGESTAGSLFSPSYGVYGKGDLFSYAVYSDGAAYVKGPLTVTGDAEAANLNISGDLTVAGAVDSGNAANAPVCANAGGKLGPCNSLNYSSKVAYVGDGPDSYESVLAALFWSGSWCGTPSSSSRCVIKVSPGTYDLGANNLTLLNFFTIEGEGPNETIFTGSALHTIYVNDINGVTLRNFGIDNTYTGGVRHPLRIRNSSNIKIENVEIRAGAGAAIIGIRIDDSDVAIKDTDIILTTSGGDAATGIKVSTVSLDNVSFDNVKIVPYAFGSGLTIGVETNESIKIKDLHVSFDATIGILSHGGTTVLRHSFIDAYNTSIKTDNASATVKVRFSELTNATSAATGTIACTATTQGSSFYTNTCP